MRTPRRRPVVSRPALVRLVVTRYVHASRPGLPPFVLLARWMLLAVMLLPPRVARSDESPPPWAAPPLESAVSLRCTNPALRASDKARASRTDETAPPADSESTIPLSRGFDLLAKPAPGKAGRIVFLGETHTDESTHRLELATYEALCDRTGNRVVLSLEMFDRDVQATLDAYLAGKIDEASFLKSSRPWNNYRTAYRPLIEAAKRRGLPVVAANFPRTLRRRVMMAGKTGWEAVRKASPQLVPRQLLPHSPLYWKRVDNAIRGHLAMMQLPDDPAERLLSTQSLWDNTMAESCLAALKRHPGWIVLHVNGGFHSAYHDGTVRQVKLRAPQTDLRTVAIVPVGNPATAQIRGKPPADLVAFVEARAENEHDGKWHVVVSRSTAYRLMVPRSDAHHQHHRRWGLLIWLGDDGLASADGIAQWKSHFDAPVAVAVLDPTYRAEEADLSPGGRWFWPDSFAEDLGTAAETIERTWGYLMRHYPIDPSRVVLAGEGTGATVVAAATLRTDRLSVRAVAWQPARYHKLRDLPLPLPELWGDDRPPRRQLTVVADRGQADWWRKELNDYRRSSLETQLVERAADPWERSDQRKAVFGKALQLAASPDDQPPQAARPKRFLRLPTDATVRARYWMERQADLASRHGNARVVVLPAAADAPAAKPIELDVTPDRFAAPGRLPRCPGPFGGTTVLVLPPELPPRRIEAWLALERDDPIATQSRFHRLRIAVTDASHERYLPRLLEELARSNRRNVLIVPATFAASVAQMQQLKQLTRSMENGMTLQWLPGLGGQNAWFAE